MTYPVKVALGVETPTPRSWVNTTLYLYQDTGGNLQHTAATLNDVTTSNETALAFATTFFQTEGEQTLILQPVVNGYIEDLCAVNSNFLFVCSDATGSSLEQLLAYAVGRPYIMLFRQDADNPVVAPKSINIIQIYSAEQIEYGIITEDGFQIITEDGNPLFPEA